MGVDLSQLIENTQYNAFKNNAIYTGDRTITGSTGEGANVRTFTVGLDSIPDMVDIVFNGPTNVNDSRPANGWFKQGRVWVAGTDIPAGYNNHPTDWIIYGAITGTTLTITATFSQTFIATLALTNTGFSYRVIDYSAF